MSCFIARLCHDAVVVNWALSGLILMEKTIILKFLQFRCFEFVIQIVSVFLMKWQYYGLY